MVEQLKPRLDYIDLYKARLALENFRQYIPELLAELRQRPHSPQIHFSFLASHYEAIALFSYGLGYPLSDTRNALAEAAKAYLEVFRLRGTESAFPAYVLTYDPAYAPEDPASIVEFRSIHKEGAKDYSLSNSRSGYAAVCMALVGGEDALAEQVAALIWDPPDASYIGPGAFCTANDQRLAYALRQIFQGDHEGALEELRGVKPRSKEWHVRYQASVLRALATNNAELFIDGLGLFLAWHAKEARKARNQTDPCFFLCTTGLGFCRIAIRRKLIDLGMLPQDDVFLPIELISAF